MSEATPVADTTSAPLVEVFARPGYHVNDEQARVVFEAAKQLPEEQRTAEALLGKAALEEGPLHDLFEWDDARAAFLHRVQQARIFLRSVGVRILRGEDVVERPAFFGVRIERETEQRFAYVRYGYASREERLKEQIVEQAFTELSHFRNKYRKHEELFMDTAPELVDLLRMSDEVLG